MLRDELRTADAAILVDLESVDQTETGRPLAGDAISLVECDRLEQRAINLYSDRAATTTDADERALYEWLAEWECGHLHLLNNMDKEQFDDMMCYMDPCVACEIKKEDAGNGGIKCR